MSAPRWLPGCLAERPCLVACRYGLDASAESCALDVAAQGPRTLLEVAALLGIERDAVRRLEARALARLGAAMRGQP